MRATKWFDDTLWRFIIVGLFNTFLGVVTMFGLYHWFNLGYWGASALSYFLCSLISFFLNKRFTFKNNESYLKTGLRFALNIGVCYFAAYLMAKPLVKMALLSFGWQWHQDVVEQIAMLFGMCLFTAFNYFGQKWLVFKK